MQHLLVIVHRARLVAEVVIARRQSLVGIHALVFLAYVEKAEPVVRRQVEDLKIVVRLRKIRVFVRTRAVQRKRFVEHAQCADRVPAVDARLRDVEELVRAQIEFNRLFFHS